MIQLIEISEQERELLAMRQEAVEVFMARLVASMGIPPALYRGTLCLASTRKDGSSRLVATRIL